jgi:hypothetical protein
MSQEKENIYYRIMIELLGCQYSEKVDKLLTKHKYDLSIGKVGDEFGWDPSDAEDEVRRLAKLGHKSPVFRWAGQDEYQDEEGYGSIMLLYPGPVETLLKTINDLIKEEKRKKSILTKEIKKDPEIEDIKEKIKSLSFFRSIK